MSSWFSSRHQKQPTVIAWRIIGLFEWPRALDKECRASLTFSDVTNGRVREVTSNTVLTTSHIMVHMEMEARTADIDSVLACIRMGVCDDTTVVSLYAVTPTPPQSLVPPLVVASTSPPPCDTPCIVMFEIRSEDLAVEWRAVQTTVSDLIESGRAAFWMPKDVRATFWCTDADCVFVALETHYNASAPSMARGISVWAATRKLHISDPVSTIGLRVGQSE